MTVTAPLSGSIVTFKGSGNAKSQLLCRRHGVVSGILTKFQPTRPPWPTLNMWLHSNGKAVGGGAESIVPSLTHTHSLGGPFASQPLIYWLWTEDLARRRFINERPFLLLGHRLAELLTAAGPSALQRLSPDSHIRSVGPSVVMAARVNVCSGVFLARV